MWTCESFYCHIKLPSWSLPLLPRSLSSPSSPSLSLFSLPHLSLFFLPLLSLFSLTTPKVNFNEPLSMLQRMVEDFIYSDILARAASCDTTLEELTYVAAFATSCYAANRVNKPFNPMLREMYECDRRAELGWRWAGQVRGVWHMRVVCEGGGRKRKRMMTHDRKSEADKFTTRPLPPFSMGNCWGRLSNTHTHTHTHTHNSYIPQTEQHEPEGWLLFRLGNVTNLLDVTPSNPMQHPLSPPPVLLRVI